MYALIGYYLANREEMDAYVCQRDQQAEQILRDMEAKPDLGNSRSANPFAGISGIAARPVESRNLNITCYNLSISMMI